MTNIGGVPLGSLILGNPGEIADPLDQHIEHHLNISQTVGLNIKLENNTSVLTFNQSVGYNIVRSRSVVSNLVFTDTIKRIREFSVTSTLTFSENQSQTHDKPVAISQNIGLAQSVNRAYNGSRLIVSGLNWSHIRSYNGIFNRNLLSTLVFNQTVLGDRVRTVSNTLTFLQSVAFNKYKHIQHTLEFQQDFIRTVIFNRRVNSLFIPFQVINRNIFVNRTIPQTLSLNHTIQADRVKGVQNTFNLTQTIDAYAAKSVKNVLPLSHTIFYNHSNNIGVNSNLVFVQDIQLVRSRVFKIHHGIGFNSFVKSHKEFNLSINQVIGLSQEIRRNVYPRIIPQVLSLSQGINYTPIYPRGITSTLSLTQTITINKVYKRTVLDNLQFLNERSVYVGLGETQYIHIPSIQYSLLKPNKKSICILQVPNAAITLPSPEWNDTENYGGIFTIRRAMNGIPYTYVRDLDLRRLKLTFILDKSKAFELREFLLQNNARIMTFTTWKGDKWFVHLQTNPTEFTPRGRFENANEKVEVSLEFEGLKVM